MRAHRNMRSLPPEARGATVAIGNFDGVHRGHRAVIGKAADMGVPFGAPLGVLTFEPHPREVVGDVRVPARLTPLRRKAFILRQLGVAHLFILRFTDAIMRLAPDAFVRKILVEQLGCVHAVTGDGFRFGHKRAGDLALLARLGDEWGFGVSTVPAVRHDGEVCSSTRIRTALEAGDVRRAAAMLESPHTVEGIVVEGDRRGRTIGFPTANVVPLHGRAQLPGPGVYAVRVGMRRQQQMVWRDAVANLGTRPTFNGSGLWLEVHLLDFDADLYGQRLWVAFVEHLRGEHRFAGPAELKAQITRDCDRAREIHAATPSYA